MMLEKRAYYYLVAGLPELVLEQAKPPFPAEVFREDIRANLHPDDFHQLQLLFLDIDNRNLLNLLHKRPENFDDRGVFSLDMMEADLREPELLPAYMRELITAFQQDTPLIAGMSWENQLAKGYYDHLLSNSDGFLHDWFSFERDRRNILAALSARRFGYSLEGQLIGDYSLTEQLRSSHARDFGVAGEYPVIERLLQLEDEDNAIEREMGIDRLRWQYIDDLNTFNYFTIEVLLGFTLKLQLITRWSPLDNVQGRESFERLVHGLEHSFEFTNEFATI